MKKQELLTDNCIWLRGQAAMVEGAIELPNGLPEMQSVLDVSALAEAQNTDLLEGRIVVSGTVNFMILYLDKMGEPVSFDARCDFKHSIPNSDAAPGMNALSRVRTGEISCQPQGSRSAAMRCEIKLDVFAWQSVQNEILDPNMLEDGLEARVQTKKLTRLISGRSAKSFVRSEVRISQNMPPAQNILLARGHVSLASATPEEGKIALEGEMKVFIISQSRDSNAPLQFFSETLPFGEIVSEDAARPGSDVFADASLERLDVELMSLDSDTASVSAVIGLNTYCCQTSEVQLVADMYSADMDCELKSVSLNTAGRRRIDSQKKIIRQTLAVPDTFPEISRVIYASSRADVTETSCMQDAYKISGIIYYSIIASTSDFGFKRLRINMPFETELSAAGVQPDMSIDTEALCESTSVEGSGKELESKVCIDAVTNERQSSVISAVSDVALTPSEQKTKSGIVVYYADGEHTLWEIAKQFRVRGGRLGGDADEIAQKGTRITLIR